MPDDNLSGSSSITLQDTETFVIDFGPPLLELA